MAKTEKSKDVNYDGLIDDLIKKIDNENSLFTACVELHVYSMTFYFVGVYIAMVVLVMVLSVGALIQNITFAIAVGAFLLAYLSFDTRGRENNVVEANFLKAIEKFKIEKEEEEKRLLLRALLKIKAIKPHSKLSIVKKMHKDMFTKEKLLERLYS